MEASREFSRTPRRLPPCSDVSVLQKTRMSHFWDTHHTYMVLFKLWPRRRPSRSAQLDVDHSVWNAVSWSILVAANRIQRFTQELYPDLWMSTRNQLIVQLKK